MPNLYCHVPVGIAVLAREAVVTLAVAVGVNALVVSRLYFNLSMNRFK